MNGKIKNRLLRIVLPILLAALLVGGCGVYLGTYYRADDEAIAAFAAQTDVPEAVLDNGFMTFGADDADFGLIFYPGGKVEHTAYVPLMRSLAADGVFCVLCEMPFRLAVFDENAADGIQEAFPQIGRWAIGGHSLGGVMAASYLSKHADAFDGLVLLGAYTAVDLSETDLRVLSVRGSEDSVLDAEKYDANRVHLPADAEELVIPGGCHAYFGMYGAQSGDGIPTVSDREQILRTADAVAEWMRGWRAKT